MITVMSATWTTHSTKHSTDTIRKPGASVKAFALLVWLLEFVEEISTLSAFEVASGLRVTMFTDESRRLRPTVEINVAASQYKSDIQLLRNRADNVFEGNYHRALSNER